MSPDASSSADPPPEALEVEPPPLERLRFGDLSRGTVVLARLVAAIVASIVRRRPRTRAAFGEAASEGLIDGFIASGPTLVKAGQIIASSAVLFPPVLAKAARRCLDAVPAFPAEQAKQTIAEDLGRPVGEIFRSFEDEPLSAASIAQVHGCVLQDGRDAVVKVQRPDIAARMALDLRIGFQLARLIEWTPWGRQTNATGIIRDLHEVTFEELNSHREAWQQDRFRRNISAFGDNDWVTAPEIYWDQCGPRVICMERVYGTPMDDFESMAERGIDGQTVLRRGAKVWAEAVMVHGPFHGDMHAGNIWVLDDGRSCYLDFGIMGELADEWKQLLRDLFYSCGFDLDFVRVARAYRSVGAIPAEFGSDEELAGFLDDVLGPMLVGGFGSLDIAALVTQSIDMLKAYDAVIPQELVLIAKQLLYVDKYTKYLAPDYSITADPFIVRNIFPEEAEARAAELGIDLSGDTSLPTRTLERPAPVAISHPLAEHGDLMKHQFLTPEWIDAAKEIRAELEGDVAAELEGAAGFIVDAPAIRANLSVEDVPFGDGTVGAHFTTSAGSFALDLGHLADADISLVIGYDTAREMIVDMNPQAAIQSFLAGKIRLDGDLSALASSGVDPLSLVQQLGLGGQTDLEGAHPLAGRIGDRIKAITA